MAEENDQERSLPATQRRLEQAREEGQVARSRELTTALLLLAASGGALWSGPAIGGWFGSLLRRGLTFGRDEAFDMPTAIARAGGLATDTFALVLPGLILLAVVAIAAPLALGGWLFTFKPLAPDLQRMLPGRWMRQLFSVHGATELSKALAKAALVTVAALATAWGFREEIALLLSARAGDAIAQAARIAGLGFLAAAAAMLLIAAVDVPAQLWQHQRGLRMSADEVRREMKETEGDPQLKQRVRAQQRAIAKRRMMADVPTADVVVTNPQHYAVALAWKESSMRAPRVVAKGADLVAARIRDLAKEHGVPVLEAPPLARALHKHTEIGEDVPAALYAAVAQVLAWTYALRAGRAPGAGPSGIEVPAGLDPLTEQGGRA